VSGLDAAERSAVAAAAERAARRFPWYAPLVRGASGTAAQISFDGVPVLDEQALAATYYASGEEPGDDGIAADERVYATSGTSSGVRKRVRWPAHDHERYVRHRAELFRALLGDDCRSGCADLGTGHAAASGVEIFAMLGLEASEIDVGLPIERHVEILAERQPDLLYTMPMILERIVAAGGPGYVPRWIIVLGDVAPPAWRAAVAAQIGMPAGRIVDVFGSIEVGAIAYSDESVGGYLFHEHIVPEAVAPTVARSDEAVSLLLTSLERDGFPAVRYAAGDLICGLRPVVVDGRRRWAYDRHLGREGAEIKHGEMLSMYSVAEAIAAAAPGVPWSLRREGMEVIIELGVEGYSAAVANAVREAVRAAHPPVDRMVRSGLIGDLRVESKVFPEGTAKRPISAYRTTG
jgi:phenylacetate-coenzyme A ligase PaaK-like adenylate-forming protein